MNILVLGGTRYFGRRLVEHLIGEGHKVTIATRGNSDHHIPGLAGTLTLDRTDKASMEQAIGENTYDVVYDQICYLPKEAQIACEVFKGKVRRYVLTSTLSVYDAQQFPQGEDLFDPYDFKVIYDREEPFNYQEGKQLAEAVFFQQAEFPVVAVRFPIVMGEDDYTDRLRFHVKRVRDGVEIGLPHACGKTSFISSDEAARFLAWTGKQRFEGPINAACLGTFTANEVIELIAEKAGKAPILSTSDAQDKSSPYCFPGNYIMDISKAVKHGYNFSRTMDWLPELIEEDLKRT